MSLTLRVGGVIETTDTAPFIVNVSEHPKALPISVASKFPLRSYVCCITLGIVVIGMPGRRPPGFPVQY